MYVAIYSYFDAAIVLDENQYADAGLLERQWSKLWEKMMMSA